MLPRVRGYVLAGGQSSRMQRPDLPTDKAMLLLKGKTLLARALEVLEPLCASVKILCGTAERCARLQCGELALLDLTAGAGPVGGLESALADAVDAGDLWALLLPVDLPGMTTLALQGFAERAMESGSAAACFVADGHTQPLPALVRADALPVVQRRLAADQRKLLPALQDIAETLTPIRGMCLMNVEDLSGLNGDTGLFWNVNTPGDLLRADRDMLSGNEMHQTPYAR